jgi:hypothetical protein
MALLSEFLPRDPVARPEQRHNRDPRSARLPKTCKFLKNYTKGREIQM